MDEPIFVLGGCNKVSMSLGENAKNKTLKKSCVLVVATQSALMCVQGRLCYHFLLSKEETEICLSTGD